MIISARALPAVVVTVLLVACSGSTTPVSLPDPTRPATASPTETASADPTTSPTLPGAATSDPMPTTRATSAVRPQARTVQTVRPPAAGTYRYAQSGTSIFGSLPAEGTLVIAPPDGRRQAQTRTVSSNETVEQLLRFRDNGVEVLSAKQRYGSGALAQTYECTFDPPLPVIKLPLRADSSWRATSSCMGMTVTFSARALGGDTLRVGGARVEAIVLDMTLTIEGDGAQQTTTSRTWLSPEHRLVIRSEQRTQGRQGSFSYDTQMTEELLSLRPS